VISVPGSKGILVCLSYGAHRRWDTTKPGLWALNFSSSGGQGSKVTHWQSYDVLGAVHLKDSSSVRCRIIEETTIFVETVT